MRCHERVAKHKNFRQSIILEAVIYVGDVRRYCSLYQLALLIVLVEVVAWCREDCPNHASLNIGALEYMLLLV